MTWRRPIYPGVMSLVWVNHYGSDVEKNKSDYYGRTPLSVSGVKVAFMDGNTSDTPSMIVKMADKYKYRNVTGR